MKPKKTKREHSHPQVYISHGKITHKVEEKCEVCAKTIAEYEKWVDGRTNEELIKELAKKKC